MTGLLLPLLKFLKEQDFLMASIYCSLMYGMFQVDYKH